MWPAVQVPELRKQTPDKSNAKWFLLEILWLLGKASDCLPTKRMSKSTNDDIEFDLQIYFCEEKSRKLWRQPNIYSVCYWFCCNNTS